MKTEINEELEKMMELIETAMREEGYKTLRMSASNGKIGTTGYDAIILRDTTGKEFTIHFNESTEPRKRANGERDFNNWVSTNYISDEFHKKFFNFGEGFPYFAMICAETEEQAIKCYVDEVCDSDEENGKPEELTFDEARNRYLKLAESAEDKQKALKEFNLYTSYDEPTTLLIDGCLV